MIIDSYGLALKPSSTLISTQANNLFRLLVNGITRKLICDGQHVRKLERQLCDTLIKELRGRGVPPERLQGTQRLLRSKELPTTYSEAFKDKKARHDALKELQDASQTFFWEFMDPADKTKDPQPENLGDKRAVEIVAGDSVNSGLDSRGDIRSRKLETWCTSSVGYRPNHQPPSLHPRQRLATTILAIAATVFPRTNSTIIPLDTEL